LYKGDARIHVSILTAFSPVFFLILVFVVVFLVPKWVQRMKDNRQELINTPASIISKRIHVTSKYIVSNTYHVTFQFLGQNRLELQVPAKAFNAFIEGGQGSLRYQGKRFLTWSPDSEASM
jgi:hypothetical protein